MTRTRPKAVTAPCQSLTPFQGWVWLSQEVQSGAPGGWGESGMAGPQAAREND